MKAASMKDDDDAYTFAYRYANLLLSLCKNYEILLLQGTETSKALFKLLIDCGTAKNLKISQISLDFWDEFKDTLTNVIIK